MASNMESLNGSPLIAIPQPLHIRLDFATTDALRRLVTVGCRAIHFSGHGNETHLYFEDGFAGVHPVPNENLRSLFSAGGSNDVKLVFVSACSSAPLANAFVNAGVPHVVAVKLNERIEDHAAIEFTKAFYYTVHIIYTNVISSN